MFAIVYSNRQIFSRAPHGFALMNRWAKGRSGGARLAHSFREGIQQTQKSVHECQNISRTRSAALEALHPIARRGRRRA